MKFIYYPYDFKCEFFPNRHNRITIEDKNIYEEFLIDTKKSIYNGENLIYLEMDGKEVKFEKESIMISTPLDLIYNKKDYQKALYNRLIEELQVNEMEDRIAEIYGELIQEMEELQYRTECNIEFEEEVDYSAILKLFGVELGQPKGSFCEKLLDYFSTQMKLMNKKIFFVVNCDSYIDKKWYNEIVRWGEYQNAIIIFVENQQKIFDENINEYILDQDMCEIH